jgi:hypothetical protein
VSDWVICSRTAPSERGDHSTGRRPAASNVSGLTRILHDRREALDVLSRELLELEHVVVEELDLDVFAADSFEHPSELLGGVLAVMTFPRRVTEVLILDWLKIAFGRSLVGPVPDHQASRPARDSG